MINYTSTLASVYSSNAYNSSSYNGAISSSSSATSGSLADTGIAVGLIVGLASIVLLVALVVRVWKRKSGKPAATSE